MQDDIAIAIRHVAKKFRLFESPMARLTEALHPFRKQYHQEYWALQDISFDIKRGEIFGILGRNGSGKSTLLQIICNVMRQTSGDIKVRGRISALLELGAGFNPEFTGRENVLLNGSIMGVSDAAMREKLPNIEAFADIGEFFDQPVKVYSSGMYVRVAFAAAIHVDPEILVVDEALSVGDAKFQHRCFQKIRGFMEQGKTILVVSHSTDTLLRICNRGAVLDAGKLSFVGPIADAVNHYQDILFGTADSNESSTDGWATGSVIDASAEVRSQMKAEEIGALVAGVEDIIATKPMYNSHETRLGSSLVRIVDFDFIVDGELNPHEISPGAHVELIVKLVFREALDYVYAGFAFVTVDGLYVFGTNTALMSKPGMSYPDGQVVAVKFAFQSHFAGGEYFLNLGCNRIVDGDDQFLDVRRSVAQVRFTDTPAVNGYVHLDVEQEVLPLAGRSTP